MNQLIAHEDFTSIQEIHRDATGVFQRAAKHGKFLRVMRNQKPLGVLVPNRVWENLMEDFEASYSPNYLKQIALSRRSKKRYSAEEVKKMLHLK